jgi:hemerythrin
MYTPQPIFWDDSLSTGDRDLDAQHKYLFEICNDLAKAIEKKRGSEVIGMVLDVLMFYAEWHFRKEENCMERHHCPVADINLKAHAVFIDKIRQCRNEYQTTTTPETLALHIHEFLASWIIQHIRHVDAQLRAAIQVASDGSGPAAQPARQE